MSRNTNFKVFSHGKYIGESAFDGRDPSMGVAVGRFLPGPGYSNIRAAIRATLRSLDRVNEQRALGLSVRTPTGVVVESDNGVSIADASTERDPDDIEIEMLGVAEFQRYFSVPGASDA